MCSLIAKTVGSDIEAGAFMHTPPPKHVAELDSNVIALKKLFGRGKP